MNLQSITGILQLLLWRLVLFDGLLFKTLRVPNAFKAITFYCKGLNPFKGKSTSGFGGGEGYNSHYKPAIRQKGADVKYSF
jgi:hypothetical protein